MNGPRKYIDLPDGELSEAPASLDDLDSFDTECDRAYDERRQREIDDEK